MQRRWLTLCVAGLVAFAPACGGDDDPPPAAVLDDAPTTERTTTTLSVEAEVEAAYLRSWDVYADAVLKLDSTKLAEVYVEEALKLRTDEVNRLKEANTPARIDVTHDISVRLLDNGEAVVRDDYMNHSVLIDGATGDTIEDDPNEIVKRECIMVRAEETWKISLVTKL